MISNELFEYLEKEIFPKIGNLKLSDLQNACKVLNISFPEGLKFFHSIDKTSNSELAVLSEFLGKKFPWRKKTTYHVKNILSVPEYYKLLRLREKIPTLLAELEYKLAKVKILKRMEKERKRLEEELQRTTRLIEEEKRKLGITRDVCLYYEELRRKRRKFLNYLNREELDEENQCNLCQSSHFKVENG